MGVGTGKSSLMFTQTFQKPGSIYVNTDISSKMIEMFQLTMSEKGLSADHLESYTPIPSEGDKKKVAIMKANNEELPFPDEEFDCYISNLSLHIVDNHHNQLLEALRVLKPGSKAGFSFWSTKETNRNFTFLQSSLKKHGYEYDLDPMIERGFRTSDPERLRQDALDAGFSIVKTFLSNLPFGLNHPNDFLNFMVKGDFDKFAEEQKIPEEEKEDLWTKVSKDFDDQYGPDAPEIPDFENIIMIATK